MGTFVFNKLVRDKLKEVYIQLNQKPTYKSLSREDFIGALKNKLIEEANEIIPEDKESVVNELADVYQVIDDIIQAYEINPDDIQRVKTEKFLKKGGFSEGLFVETIELSDDDEWNDYYRKSPEIFEELKKDG